MMADLLLNRFRFILEPKAPLRMPAYNKGNVIRGGFGSSFRRMVCHANCPDTETCELRSVCPYTAVFQPFVPEGSGKISKNRDIPRPFVIKPPLPEAIPVPNIFPMRRELKVFRASSGNPLSGVRPLRLAELPANGLIGQSNAEWSG